MGHGRRRLGVRRARGGSGAAETRHSQERAGTDARRAVGQAPATLKPRMSPPKALIAWSSGKDSAWALHKVRCAVSYEVVGALTTVTETFARVSMHGVREEILRAQF